MPLYYNADGNLKNFNSWEQTVVCPKCKKPYIQQCEEQVPGFRDKDYDVCPYCSADNGSSMSVEYRNFPMSDAEIAKYFEQNR